MPVAFARAWAARDADALAALFAEDADFVNVVGLWWHDRAAIRAAHHYGLTTFFRDSRLRVGRVKTRDLGGRAAVVQARMHLSGQLAPDGSKAGPRTTLFLFVMERRTDGWICVAAQNGEVIAGAETHLSGPQGTTPQDYR
ncbi:SgcJ/EcaC family oxidoreductase [Mesobaculum littorinae]|uniref:SgcJ/EcaC family oxidoreductase n=2 Tax=Mesobaculum littorinae TaxID=2486419 RepID=A0A438AKA6_9RHOB|nr:SgcJ/EcaC family oxidoreductase [Mesobaculum littorinae]